MSKLRTAALVLACVTIAKTAAADTSAVAAEWRADGDARRLLRDWRRCRAIAHGLQLDAADEPMAGVHLAARLTPDGVEALLSGEGSGRWAYGTYMRLRLARGRCDADGSVNEGGKESLLTGLRRIAVSGARLPSLSAIARWADAVLVDDPDRPDLAAARLLVQLAQESESRRPPVQPEHPGRPTGAPRAIWRASALKAAGVAHPWLKNESGESFDAIEHGPVRAPRLLRSSGRWEIWELRFRARLGGGLLAVYDTRSERHRWVWGTSYDGGVPGWNGHNTLDASHFAVLAVEDDRLIVRNLFEGKEHRWVIDMTNGVARPLDARDDAARDGGTR